MKITIDLKSVEQSWNPDTGEELHFLVIELGGRQHKLRCTEAELVLAVGKAKEAAQRIEEPLPLDESYDQTYEPNVSVVDEEPPELGEGVLQGLVGRVDGESSSVLPEAGPAAAQEPRKTPLELRRAQTAANTPSRPRTTHAIKEGRKQLLREVARSAPHRRVAQDEMGNPIVPQGQQFQTPEPPPPDGFEIRRADTAVRSDDDPFQQG